MEHVLKTEHIKKYYRKSDQEHPILKSLSLSIVAGKFTVLMGASGSGKSTLLHLLGGLDQPSSGHITVLGQRISDYSEMQLAKFRRKHIGFVFQDHNLINQLTLEENIMLAGYLVSKDKKAVRKRAKQLLEQLGIAQLANRLPGEVSGGESQRGAIARALINEPAVLMADEPTGNLNSESSSKVLECFRTLHQSGQSILMVTHDIPSTAYGDEVYYLKDGAIVDHMNFEKVSSFNKKREAITHWLENLGW